MSDVASNSLLAEIERKAQEEVQNLQKMSEQKIARKTTEDEGKRKNLVQQIEQEMQTQLNRLDHMMQSNLDMETRRTHLKEQESVIKEVMAQVNQKMRSMITQSGYSQVLLGWITEAALGVSGSQLVIRTSPEEAALINQDLIKGVIKNVSDLGAGRVVSFELDTKNHLLGQGVVVLSAESQLQFSNTVSDRLMRYDSQVRSYIFDHVLKVN